MTEGQKSLQDLLEEEVTDVLTVVSNATTEAEVDDLVLNLHLSTDRMARSSAIHEHMKTQRGMFGSILSGIVDKQSQENDDFRGWVKVAIARRHGDIK